MKIKQLMIELRKSFGLFMALIFGRIAVVAIAVLSNSEFIRSFIRPMYTFVAWIVILIYIFVDLYRELYFGKNKLILMIPFKSSFMWHIKYIAYSVYIIIFSCVGYFYEFFTEYGFYNLQIKESFNSFQGGIYYILSDIVSSLCGLSLLFLSVAFGRMLKNKGLSYFITVLTFLGVTIGWVVCILNGSGAIDGDYIWTIGIMSTAEVNAYNQFAGIIPVMIIPKTEIIDISETISPINLLSNVFVLILSVLFVHILSNTTKHDYIEN